MKKILTLIGLLLVYSTVFAQTTEQQIDELLHKLSEGENIEGLVVNIRDVRFETGSAELNVYNRQLLDKVIVLLNRVENIDLKIVGHTDNVGTESQNLVLSSQRASSIKVYLINNGVEASRLTAIGMGEQVPLVENTTAENRAINRRVEFEVIKTSRKKIIQIQDIIVFNDETQKGVIYIGVSGGIVEYRNIETDKLEGVSKNEIKKVILSSGEIITFKKEVETTTSVKPSKSNKLSFDKFKARFKKIPFFKPSKKVSKSSSIYSLSLGPVTTIGRTSKYYKTVIPPVAFTFEKAVINNIRFQFHASYYLRKFRLNESFIKHSYHYYTVGAGLNYHINLNKIDKLDPYLGLNLNFRQVRLASPTQKDSNHKISLQFMAGIRYYLLPNMALQLEAGNNSTSAIRFGIAVLLPKSN